MAAWPSQRPWSSTSCRTPPERRPRGSFTRSRRSSPTRRSRRCATRASSRSRISSSPCGRARGRPAVVFYTLVKPELRDAMRARVPARARPLLRPARPADRRGRRASRASRHRAARARARRSTPAYFRRIEAIEFAVRYDDGIGGGLDEADVVLVGVSRTSKTPLSMYLGNLGYKTANVPIVAGIEPPQDLFRINPVKVVGLTIDANRLGEIRTARARNFGGTARQYSELVEDLRGARAGGGRPPPARLPRDRRLGALDRGDGAARDPDGRAADPRPPGGAGVTRDLRIEGAGAAFGTGRCGGPRWASRSCSSTCCSRRSGWASGPRAGSPRSARRVRASGPRPASPSPARRGRPAPPAGSSPPRRAPCPTKWSATPSSAAQPGRKPSVDELPVARAGAAPRRRSAGTRCRGGTRGSPCPRAAARTSR